MYWTPCLLHVVLFQPGWQEESALGEDDLLQGEHFFVGVKDESDIPRRRNLHRLGFRPDLGQRDHPTEVTSSPWLR